MTPEEENKIIVRFTDMATKPMDLLMKKQSKLTQEMLSYSFQLGQKLGYIAGYSEAQEGKPMKPECTPEALGAFINQVKN